MGGSSKFKAAAAAIHQAKASEKKAKSSYISCCQASAACSSKVKDQIVARAPRNLAQEDLDVLELVASGRRLLGAGKGKPVTKQGVRQAMRGKSLSNTAAAAQKAAKAMHNKGFMARIAKAAQAAVAAKKRCMADWRKRNPAYKDFGVNGC